MTLLESFDDVNPGDVVMYKSDDGCEWYILVLEKSAWLELHNMCSFQILWSNHPEAIIGGLGRASDVTLLPKWYSLGSQPIT